MGAAFLVWYYLFRKKRRKRMRKMQGGFLFRCFFRMSRSRRMRMSGEIAHPDII
jgi:hypothetical protein